MPVLRKPTNRTAAAARVLCVVLAPTLGLTSASWAQPDNPEWRFSVVRAGDFDTVSGGGDVTGDGIDDIVAGLVNYAPVDGEGGGFVARVVSGAPRDAWVSDPEASELAVRGVVGADGQVVRICRPQIIGDVSGDGIDELLIQNCLPEPDGRFRVFVVFGSAEGGEVRLGALGGAGFEVEVPSLGAEDEVRYVAALADVGGSPGLAVYLAGSEPAADEVRVYRLTGGRLEPWAAYEGASQPGKAGDFFGDGGSDLVLVDSGPQESVAYAVRVPSSPQTGARRVSDLGADEAQRLGFVTDNIDGLRGGLFFNGVGDVDGDGFDDVAIGAIGVHQDHAFGQDIVLGGPTPDQGARKEFPVEGSAIDAAQPAGDLDGDGIDDLVVPRPGGFSVVYGSRTVEPVDLDQPGTRSTGVTSPLSSSPGRTVARIGGPAIGEARVATTARLGPHLGDGVLLFEPPRVAPRRGVAFAGDPASVDRVAGDPAEASDVADAAAREREAVMSAVEVSRRAFPGSGAQHVVLASATSFADALSASPLLGRGPLLLTPSSALPVVVEAELHRVLAYRGTVYVVGGPAAVSETATAELADCRGGSDQCYRVQRIAGASRVETAAAVARLVGAAPGREVAVARAYGTLDASGADVTGAGWADAVTAGGWAAATGTPMLLTPSEEGLHPAVADVVTELGVSSTVVLGGAAAVSDEAAAGLPGVRRVAGRDRAETAVAVSEQLWPPGTTRRILIDGYREDGWTAGLPAAGLAADGAAPLLLSQGDQLPPATAEALRACPPEQPADVLLVGPAADGSDTLASNVSAAQRCS